MALPGAGSQYLCTYIIDTETSAHFHGGLQHVAVALEYERILHCHWPVIGLESPSILMVDAI